MPLIYYVRFVSAMRRLGGGISRMFAAARGQGKPARDADTVRDEDADWLSVGQSFQGKTREKDASQRDNVNERSLKVYKKSSHKKKKKKRRRTSKWSDEESDERERGKKRKKESKHKKRKNETRYRRSYSSSSSTSASEDEDRQSRREDKASWKRRRRGSSEDRMVRAKDEWELVDMHDDAIEVYKKAPGDDKLFEFDCAGDRDNLLYGSLYVHEQPLYHLATKRSVIDGKWTVPKQKPRLLASGHHEREEKREERYFGPTRRKMEKIMGQRRLHLAYSERRMDRSQQQSTELAYIPVGPILDGELAGVAGEENGDNEDRDDSLLMQTDLERIEEYLVTKGKALNEKVNAEPQNVEAWLDLIAFQQEFTRLFGAKKRDPDKSVVLEKQRAVLIKALEHNPSSSELRRLKLNMMMIEMKGSGRSVSVSSEEYRKHIETMLENDPINADLWLKLIELSQQKFSTFSVPMIRDLYARTVSVLSKELTKRITGEDPSNNHKTAISSVQVFSSGSLLQASRDPYEDKDLDPRAASLSTTLMEFHSGMATMESKAGYVERAIGHLVALSAFNDMKSSESKPLNHQEMVQRFGAQLGQSDLLAWIRETSGFACFPKYVPQPESLNVFLSAKTKLDRILERINPSNELRMPQHGPSLSSPGHLRFEGVVGAEDTPDNAVSDDNETAHPGKWVYSNLHGYRIWVGEADDAQEYERILQELRGTEDSQTRQVAVQQKLQKKQSRVQASLMALRDERAEYSDVPESDTFVQWISEEIAAQAVQWEPLQASNPHHAEVIEEQPDRAILTEELQPFLFRVHKSHRIDIIFGILRTMGVQLAWDKANSVESQYGDDFDYCQMLSQPILEALESTHSSSLLLKPGERLALLRQHICTDVQVSQQALIDPERVQFIRSLFVLALQKATPDKEQVRGIKALWIGYETQVLVRMKDREAAIDSARSFCQELLASDQLAPQSPIDAGVMFAYAKMELSLGNDKQVVRICEKTLPAIMMSSKSGSPRSQDFHRLIYLRVRGELKDLKEGNARDPKPSVKLLRAFYVLQSVWSPQGEQIDRFAKKYRGAGLRTALQEILTQKRNETIDRYRMELEVAINQCAKHYPKRHHLSLDRVTMCPVGFCLYNLCMAIYIAHGYGAAHQEFQEFLSQISLTQVPCHGRFCWYLHLEFMESHQVNAGFPWVAPREWRDAVEQSVQRFPTDPLFLRLFVDAEANNPMSQKIQRYFHQVKHRRQRCMDSPSVVEWLFVLHYEFGRAERSADKDLNTGDGDAVPTQTCCLFHRWRKNLPAVERVRRVFEDMVDQVDTRGNALCWRLFLRFEIAMGKVEAARKVFYRALASCPWSKELYLDGIRVLRAYLTEGECREIQEFMIAKELHVRVDP